MSEFILGWEEWVALPELGLPAVLAKTDTGARTSALHAYAIEPFGPIGRPCVRFVVQPWPERPEVEVVCSAPLVDRREVTSSNGDSELRYIVETKLQIGGRERSAELSLTDRERLRYRMLIGRSALGDDARIDPSRSFVQGALSYDHYAHTATAPVRRPLRIALLTQAPSSFSCRRLIEAAGARDHVIEAVETRQCTVSLNPTEPLVYYEGKPLPRFDAVIPRIGPKVTQYGCAVMRQFSMMGVYGLNGADAIAASRDKLAAHQALARHGVPMPATAFASPAAGVDQLIASVGGPPIVVKLLESSQGRGVVLAETRQAARSVIHAFQDLAAAFLVQEFIAEAGGADIRLFVLGGRVVAAMKRQAKAGEFRSNLHRGGSAEAVKPTKLERDIAARAARAMGLEVAGVDMLRGRDGPKVLEVNSSPGLEGVERVTGEDIAGLLIDHLEARVRPSLRRRRAAAGLGV